MAVDKYGVEVDYWSLVDSANEPVVSSASVAKSISHVLNQGPYAPAYDSGSVPTTVDAPNDAAFKSLKYEVAGALISSSPKKTLPASLLARVILFMQSSTDAEELRWAHGVLMMNERETGKENAVKLSAFAQKVIELEKKLAERTASGSGSSPDHIEVGVLVELNKLRAALARSDQEAAVHLANFRSKDRELEDYKLVQMSLRQKLEASLAAEKSDSAKKSHDLRELSVKLAQAESIFAALDERIPQWRSIMASAFVSDAPEHRPVAPKPEEAGLDQFLLWHLEDVT